MADILHQVGIASDPASVYNALTTLNGLGKWWTRDITGSVEKGGVIRARFGKNGPDMEVRDCTPVKRVSWKCVLGNPEWVNTDIIFEISSANKGSVLNLTHSGWKNPTVQMRQSNTKWAMFLLSLKHYLEDGKGYPCPDDVKITTTGL